MKRILEVCVGSVASAIAAREGGAARVELCSALEVGGVTPSLGLIQEVRAIEGLKLHVLIRPRGGDFLYDDTEVACMEQDIIAARNSGVDGVVVGALTSDGDVDVAVCRRLIEAAEGMSITFHRAFDMCRYPLQALEDVIELGCHRLLTSGQAGTAQEGVMLLKQLVDIAGKRIIVMPGCGVSADNARFILDVTGADEIHASARRNVGSGMLYRHCGVNMGSSENDEYARKETHRDEVQRIVAALNCI